MYSVCLDSCGNDCRKSCLPTFNHMYVSLLCPLCVYIYKSVVYIYINQLSKILGSF